MGAKIKDSIWTLIIWTAIPAAFGVLVWVYWYLNKMILIENTPQTVIAFTNA